MKKVVVALTVISCLAAVVLSKAIPSLPAVVELKKSTKKNCTGYTILSVDKAVNCNGDTILITRKHGFYQTVKD